jgi:hypothetical protein
MSGVRTHPAIIGEELAKRLRSFRRPEQVSAPLVAHEALKCPRRIGFRLFGVEPDIKYTREEIAAFGDGDFIDSVAAEVFAIRFGARTQLRFHWLPEVALAGKADVGYRADGVKVVGEVKSTNQKAWTRAVGLWEGVPAEPKIEWLVQAGLAACSPMIDAPQVHIVLVDSERFETAEWLIPVDEPLELSGQPEPVSIRQLVTAEVDRLRNVLTCCEGGTLPPRDVPGYGIVESPPARDEYGEPWTCRYCNWQPSCSKLESGPIHDFGEMVS